MAIESLPLPSGQAALLAAAGAKGGQPLAAGQVIEAKVAAVLDSGAVKLQTVLGLIEAMPQTPLKPGATLLLQVQRDGGGLKLVPCSGAAQTGAAAPAPNPAPASSPAVIVSGSGTMMAAPGTAATVQGGAGLPSATLPQGGGQAGATLPGQPAAPGAMPQAGSAPTGTQSGGATGSGGGSAAPLSGGAGAGNAQAGQTVQTGVAAQAAQAGQAGQTGQAASAAAPGRVAMPENLKAAVQTAVRADVGRQGGIAALFSDLSAAFSGRGAPMPEPVARAAAALFSFRFSGDAAPRGEDLKAALSRSGVFLEARLATGQAPAGGDLKAALGALRSALLTWLGDEAAGGAAHDQTLMPPRRNGALMAQKVATAGLPGGADATTTARHLLADTEAAMSRMRMTQAAALPDASDTAASRSEPGLTQWIVDLPIGLGRETTVAQFAISRDARRKDERKGPVWQVRFAMDVEPLGPVDALVTMAGEKVGVTLWAERPETAETLTRGLADLKDALSLEAFEVEEVRCRPGRQGPGTPPPRPSGYFVDRQS
ncbi:MAG: flagellar hook-length control protein FliK [Hyphomicrobiales bacterium]